MKVIVIGGGAAGMMAAIAAAQSGAKVTLLEKNEKLGKKIYITGKGRCNVTNACDMTELFERIVTNPRFLYASLYSFTNQDLMEMLEAGGCALKTERGERVFPVSDKAYDVTDCLKRYMSRAGVEVLLNTEVQSLLTEARAEDETSASSAEEAEEKQARRKKKETLRSKKVVGVVLAAAQHEDDLEDAGKHAGKRKAGGKKLFCDRVIVATGGLSYPSTGSTGDGLRFARMAGISVTEPCPALVPLETEEDAARLQGLSLKNIAISVRDEAGKAYASDFGELLFTHFGLSGPVVLSASSRVTRLLNQTGAGRTLLTLHIDLKPALTDKQLDERLLRDFSEAPNRQLKNAFAKLFPAKLIPVFVERLGARGIDGNKPVNALKREERKAIVELIRDFSFTLRGTRGFREAIITQGGVDVRALDPSTMESRAVEGLYFAGEVIDIDAVTGGFNLQLAFSTGHLAGTSAAQH